MDLIFQVWRRPFRILGRSRLVTALPKYLADEFFVPFCFHLLGLKSVRLQGMEIEPSDTVQSLIKQSPW